MRRTSISRCLSATTALAVALLLSVSAASGATRDATELNLSFAQQGQLTRVLVRAGDHVRKGQLLAQIDPAQAENAVATSEAAVMTARAQLLHETEGISRADRAANRAALVTAIAGVRAALQARADDVRAAVQTLAAKRHALQHARQRLASARASVVQNALGTQAAIDQARGQLLADSGRLASDQAQLALDQQAAADTSDPSQATGAVAADQSAIRSDTDAIRQDQNAVANALNAQGAGTIADRQTIEDAATAVTSAVDDLAASRTAARTTRHSADAAVRSARLAVRSTRAANAQSAQPARPDAILQARAGLRSANASLANAELTLAQTELRAPAAGTIVAVDGNVGETPGAGSSPSSGASSGGGGAFITMIASSAGAG